MRKAREILIDVVKKSEFWNGNHEPEVWFMELGDQTITLWVAAWADDAGKAWRLKCDILDNALHRLQEAGIPLPRTRFQSLQETPQYPGHAGLEAASNVLERPLGAKAERGSTPE